MDDSIDRTVPQSAQSEPRRAQCIRDVDWFGPRTNAATRHSDKRRRRPTRWPMDRSPKCENRQKVDRAIELRGRGDDPPSARIWSLPSSPTVGRTHAAAATRVRWGQSATHACAPIHCARGGNLSLQPVRAHTPPRRREKSRRGLRPKRWGQRTRRHPAIERQTHGSSHGQPRRTPSSRIRCDTHIALVYRHSQGAGVLTL